MYKRNYSIVRCTEEQTLVVPLRPAHCRCYKHYMSTLIYGRINWFKPRQNYDVVSMLVREKTLTSTNSYLFIYTVYKQYIHLYTSKLDPPVALVY